MSKTRDAIRKEFARKGLSYTAWAKQRGYSPNMVIEIINDDDINPKRKCLRGDCHNIAVELGLKDGEVNRQLVAA
ncbi:MULTISPECIES: helix-turn-helix domain-containing protein [Undibacterium]|jgi:gp16 family phage-associated protein|uniref:DNA-binding protein n=1 Tax=Undibacterium aquatile TaxID=1537398 RepID=A0ABR6XJJ7_9BURK|nr:MULTISPECIES: DNA-binding protein [Undibacterium]MBC3813080.1 DNA-binding protein [Undibacterium aquatile]MBK1890710.1 DNA-binding protein [Undibacterium sp. 14-3-2]